MKKLKTTLTALAAALALSGASAHTQQVREPDLTVHLKFAGAYRCVLNENIPERERVDTGWFDNLITNIGLDRIAQTTAPGTFTYASIGTGTTAPANTDTSLVAWVASATPAVFDSQSNGGASTYVAQCQFHHVYTQGAVVGNMAEVGIGWSTGGTNLWSRARILDGGGSPTTLTVTSLDQLTTYYKLTCTPVITDLTSSVTISAVSYDYTCRLANAASFMAGLYNVITNNSGIIWGRQSSSGSIATVYPAASVLGAITGVPTGSGSGAGSCAAPSYTPGDYFVDSVLVLSPSEGNVSGGIGCLLLNWMSSQMQFQYQFTSAPLPKDNTKTLTLNVRFSWGR